MMLTPDELQGDIYRDELRANMKHGAALLFAHGLNIHFNLIEPRKRSSTCSWSRRRAPATPCAANISAAAACPAWSRWRRTPPATRWSSRCPTPRPSAAAAPASSRPPSREECETDLFGEQVVLCGGLVELIRAGFETLVEAGYAPEMAYFECLHEVKLIVDLIYEGGIANMNYSISQHRRVRRIRHRPAHHHARRPRPR